MSLETTSGTISTQNPLQHMEGRSLLRTIYTTDQDRLKQVIIDVYSNRIVEFINIAQKPEGHTYDFTIHNWRAKTDEDGEATTDIHKASRDFLVQRVEQLAKGFVEGTNRSEELIKDFLLCKLNVGKFKSTEDYIENGQTHIGVDHKKLSALLTKIHDGSFKEKTTKVSESDSVDCKETAVPLNSPSTSAPLSPLSLSLESSEQLLAGLAALPPQVVDDQNNSSVSDEGSFDGGYDSPISEGSPRIVPFNAGHPDEENVEETKSVPAPLSEDEPVPTASASSSIPAVSYNESELDSDEEISRASTPEEKPDSLMAASSSNTPEEPAIAYLDSSDSESQVDDVDQASLAEEIENVDEQTKSEESEQSKKSRSAIARFFARIGNGIEKFFKSILNFFKNLFSKK